MLWSTVPAFSLPPLGHYSRASGSALRSGMGMKRLCWRSENKQHHGGAQRQTKKHKSVRLQIIWVVNPENNTGRLKK